MVMIRTAAKNAPQGDAAPAVDLASILLESLSELANAGNVETACKLAGFACVRLRRSDPRLARQFDIFLHRRRSTLNGSREESRFHGQHRISR